eukprot:1541791-Rhodomonas_salina.1
MPPLALFNANPECFFRRSRASQRGGRRGKEGGNRERRREREGREEKQRPSRSACWVVLWKRALALACAVRACARASASVATVSPPTAHKCSTISTSRHQLTAAVSGSAPPGM